MADSNIKRITIFLLFTSTAIALPASWVYCDMLLLRMHFDYALFGVIKSSMFLLPALIYWGTCGFIRKLNQSALICRWSYLARILIPLFMPVTALITANTTIRMWTCVFSLALSYSSAMIANNTLLTLYRQAIPFEKFNKYALFFSMVFGLPCSLLSIPIAWLLGRMPLEDQQFILWFMIYEIILGFCYLPAFLSMRNLKLTDSATATPHLSLKQYIEPVFDRKFIPILGLNFIQSIWVGIVSSYWNVYLLTELGWEADKLLIAEAILAILSFFIIPRFGILADKRGYGNCFAWINGFLLATAFAGWLSWHMTFTVYMLLLIIHNANNGIFSGSARQLILSAAVGMGKSDTSEQYIAISSLFGALGCFAGCCMASQIFSLVTQGAAETAITSDHYRLFFLIANLLLIPQLLLTFFIKKIGVQQRITKEEEVNKKW